MLSATLEMEKLDQQKAAEYEQWIQAEFAKDPRTAALKGLYNDIRTYGEVQPDTWTYFDDQEKTGGAESLQTKHITHATATYDQLDGQLVANIAGGERITYDSFTVNGLKKSHERAAADPVFEFQQKRDQIYHDNFHGIVKDMWRGDTDYDTVMYVSAFPEELLYQGEAGQKALQSQAYDTEGYKAFINIFRRSSDGQMEFCAVRVGNGLKKPFERFLQEHGYDDTDFDNLTTHDLGALTVQSQTNGRSMQQLAAEKAVIFDSALAAETGKMYDFGQENSSIDAYQLFDQCPEIWDAYKAYHFLLAEHLTGRPLDNDFQIYINQTHEAVGDHVLKPDENWRLSKQIAAGKITIDMALACKKVMTYSHYAMLDAKLQEYLQTGKITNLAGDLMEAYGDAAESSGGMAAESGINYNDCESSYGSSAEAAILAEREGITIEEALRRTQVEKPREWKIGQCRNCSQKGMVGECDVCLSCENAHTKNGDNGLAQRRKIAEQAMRAAVATGQKQRLHIKPLAENAEPAIGQKINLPNGKTMVFSSKMVVGGAQKGWIDPATGEFISS